MLAFMPSQSVNLPSGLDYWYGNNNLPEVLEEMQHGLPSMARRLSEAVLQGVEQQSQGSAEWDDSRPIPDHDFAQLSLALHPQAAAAVGLQKAPLAPKQGLGGSQANARGQHSSPISGTYALRTPRGKITSIACESCRKRKSKCDGIRPKCNTCQSKNLTCVYDVAEDGKTTTQLRAHVRRMAKELDDMKSVLSPLVTAPDRSQAAYWATELGRNGFANHTLEEVKASLQGDATSPIPALPHHGSFGSLGSDPLADSQHDLGGSSYAGSSREESRDASQTMSNYMPAAVVDGVTQMNPPVDIEAATNALGKFSFDCTYFQTTKRNLLSTGWSEAQIFGRAEIDVDSILLGFVDPQDTQNVPTWCSRTVNKILPASPLPIRLASAWILTKMMRYLIWPTVENMTATPEWVLPTLGKQDVTPHDILIDLIPWPQVRQLLYQQPHQYPIGQFVGLVGMTWPYADDTCHYWDIEANCARMTPLFESTVADLSNWTLDPRILEVVPQLEGVIPLSPV